MMTRRTAEEQAQDIRDAFRALDRNADGYISADELKYVMSNLGEKLSDGELAQMIAEADVDGDGRIDYNGRFNFMALVLGSIQPGLSGSVYHPSPHCLALLGLFNQQNLIDLSFHFIH